MTELLIDYVELVVELARIWGPLIVLILMAVESSFVPFPSEIVMIPAGFMAARGEFVPAAALPGLLTAVACGIIGSLLGAWLNYWLSLRLGRPFLYRYGRYVLVSPSALGRAEAVFRRHGEVATFVCRLIPAIRQLISIPAGLSRMNFRRFSLFTGLGAGIWVTILALIGYTLGAQTQEMTYPVLVHAGKETARENLVWILVGCAMIIAVYGWVHHRVMRGRSSDPAGS